MIIYAVHVTVVHQIRPNFSEQEHEANENVAGNFFSQVIFSFLLLLWMFSFVLH